MKTYDKVIGIDFGNGFVNIVVKDSKGLVFTKTLPSSFVKADTMGQSFGTSTRDLMEFNIEGTVIKWGDDIARLDVIDTYGHENRYRTDMFKIITQLALGYIVRELDIQATDRLLVVTGVPTDESGNAVIEKDIATAIKGNSKGLNKLTKIEYDENGEMVEQDIMYCVEDVLVLPQGLSVVLGRYYNCEGMIENIDYEEMKVAVVDIGGGTIDIELVHELNRLNEHISIREGFRDVYNNIRAKIKESYPNATPNDYELLKIINDEESIRLDKYIYKPSKLKQGVDFTEVYKTSIDSLIMSIQRGLMNKMKSLTDLDEILLVGGSARLFEERLNDVMQGFTIPQDHAIANAVGYFNYGTYYNSVIGDE